MTSMICFLKSCDSLYRFDGDEVHKPESRSLLEFARDRFRHIAFPLRRHMLTFFNHLPRNFIGEQNFQYIVQLLSLLDSLETLLFQENLESEELQHIFLHQGKVGSFKSFVDTLSLPDVITKCLSKIPPVFFLKT